MAPTPITLFRNEGVGPQIKPLILKPILSMGYTISIHLDPIETELFERMRQHVSMSSTIWIILYDIISKHHQYFQTS